MRVIRFRDRVAVPRQFKVGVETDTGVEQIKFELPHFSDDQVEVIYWQNDEYSDVDALDDGVWTITYNMTRYSGDDECYIAISVGDEVLWHSERFHALVHDLPDTENVIEQEYPSAIQQGVNAALAAQAAAEDAQEAAETAAASLLVQLVTVEVDENNRIVIGIGGGE